LVVGGEAVTLGAPTVAGAMVAAEVIEQARGPKIIAFKKRRRKNSRRRVGHRSEFTLLRITEILTDGNKPTKEARPRPKRAPVPAAADGSVEAADDAAAKSHKSAAKKAEKPKSKAPAKAKKPAAKHAKKGKKK